MAAIVAEGFEKLRDQISAAGAPATDAYDKLTRIGRAYVAFALSHPAHFKLMFRSEWVNANKHEAAGICAGEAFDVLAGAIAGLGEEGRPADTITLMMAWSLAHGLATLMLEGKLDRASGLDLEGQRAAADEVLARFEGMIRRR